MDDRTWYLAVGSLAASVVAIVLDAVLAGFHVPGGFWTIPAAVFGFLGARSAIQSRRNGE